MVQGLELIILLVAYKIFNSWQMKLVNFLRENQKLFLIQD